MGLDPRKWVIRYLPRIRTVGAAAAALVLVGGASGERPKTQQLRLAVTGGGGVASSDGRIRCPPRCSASYERGAVVVLQAIPGRYFSFARWSGECVGAAPKCIVAVDRATAASAAFERLRGYVRLAVGGPGTIVSEPSGLTCGAVHDDCTGTIGQGVTVRLLPTRDGALAAWGGACEGSGLDACTFVVADNTDVSAGFRHGTSAPGPHALDVRLPGRAGKVTSDPPGIDCPPACSASFAAGALVRLRTPVRYQWGRACVGTGANCILVVDRPLDVFALPPSHPARPDVGLNVSVSGRGVVTGERIRCGGVSGTLLECEALFSAGTRVVLRAVPPRFGRFHAWSGFCRGREPVCEVVVSAPKTVIAVFRR